MIREGTISIPFTYAAGGVASRFLIALRDDKALLGSRCDACDRVRCPAGSFCPQCGAATSDLVEVGPGGALETWTVDAGGEAFGMIRIDGADSAMLHRLIGPATQWRRGARVRPRFADQRTGSILDIQGFELEPEQTP